MSRKTHFRRFSTVGVILAGAFFFHLQSAQTAIAAQDPQPPPPAAAQDPQPPPAKVKKVWTNDELESSRTPMDQYLADKEAREAASAAQAAADAIPSQQLPLWIKMPATVSETRQAIGDTLQDINDQKDAIDRLNKELESAPEEQKAGIRREIDRHTTGVQTSQQEMKTLQDYLKQLNRKSPSENSPDLGKLPSE